MLNYLWSGMILTSVVWAMVQGNLGALTQGALDAAGEAVSLAIAMLGVMSFWTGILEIGKRAGLIENLAKRMGGLMRLLFPDVPRESEASRQICVNLIANVLGLGWAATPAGLCAMQELKKLEAKRLGYTPDQVRRASRAMCTFLILNISSLQLIPVNMIAYRAQYKSAASTAIVGPSVAATFASTAAALVFCLIARRCSPSDPARPG